MKHLKNWAAVYVLLGLFTVSWYFQYVTMWEEYKAQPGPALRNEFWIEWWAATLENWQSEFLQLLVQAVLIASFIQSKLFRADYSADKEDVEKILRAIEDKN